MWQCAQIAVGKTFIIWNRARKRHKLYGAIWISRYGDFLGREMNETEWKPCTNRAVRLVLRN